MLKLIHEFYVLGNKAIDNYAELDDILNSEAKERIGRAKYVPESETKARYDEIMAELNSEIRSLTDGGNEDA